MLIIVGWIRGAGDYRIRLGLVKRELMLCDMETGMSYVSLVTAQARAVGPAT